MAPRRFWNVAFNAKERRSSQPSAGGQGGSCLLGGVASNDCSYARSGASPDVWRGPRAEARGYYPRPLPGAGTEAMRHPGRKAINLGVWGGAPGLENARNTPTGVPSGNISRARAGAGSTQGSAVPAPSRAIFRPPLRGSRCSRCRREQTESTIRWKGDFRKSSLRAGRVIDSSELIWRALGTAPLFSRPLTRRGGG